MNSVVEVEQLELGLWPGEPWNGRSPRVLTRGHLALIFNARAAEARAFFYDPFQLPLWPTEKRAPRRRLGAPSASTLLPLPKEV